MIRNLAIPHAIRVSYNLDRLDDFMKALNPYVYIYGYEIKAERPHYHIYVETDMTYAQVKYQLIKYFCDKTHRGNSVYAFSKIEYRDEDTNLPLKYIGYCTKENNYKYENISDEDLKSAISIESKTQESIKEKKKSKQTQLQILCGILESLSTKDEEYINIKNNATGTTWTKDDIINLVITYYKEKEILIRQFQLVSLCQTLALKYTPTYEYELRHKLNDLI